MSSSLRGNQPGFTSQGKTLCYLDIHEQIQKISGRHDDGGVEWDDVAFVQVQIQVGGQPLGEEKKTKKRHVKHSSVKRSVLSELCGSSPAGSRGRCQQRLRPRSLARAR